MKRASLAMALLLVSVVTACGSSKHAAVTTVSRQQQALFVAARERNARQRLTDAAGTIIAMSYHGGFAGRATTAYLAAVDSVAGSVPARFLISARLVGLAPIERNLAAWCPPCANRVSARIEQLRH